MVKCSRQDAQRVHEDPGSSPHFPLLPKCRSYVSQTVKQVLLSLSALALNFSSFYPTGKQGGTETKMTATRSSGLMVLALSPSTNLCEREKRKDREKK